MKNISNHEIKEILYSLAEVGKKQEALKVR